MTDIARIGTSGHAFNRAIHAGRRLLGHVWLGICCSLGVVTAPVLGGCAVLHNQVEVSEIITLTGDLRGGSLLVDNPMGEVRVVSDPSAATASAQATKRARGGTPEEATARLKEFTPMLEAAAGGAKGLVAQVQRPEQRSGVSNADWGSVDWVITVPADAPLHIKASMGEVSVEGARAGVRVEASMGEVRVTGAAGGVSVDASMGKVHVEAQGPITIEASMGQVYANMLGAAAPLDIRASMGKVTARVPAQGWSTLRAHTSMGSVRASGALSAERRWVSDESGLDADFGNAGGPKIGIQASMGDVEVKFVD